MTHHCCFLHPHVLPVIDRWTQSCCLMGANFRPRVKTCSREVVLYWRMGKAKGCQFNKKDSGNARMVTSCCHFCPIRSDIASLPRHHKNAWMFVTKASRGKFSYSTLCNWFNLHHHHRHHHHRRPNRFPFLPPLASDQLLEQLHEKGHFQITFHCLPVNDHQILCVDQLHVISTEKFYHNKQKTNFKSTDTKTWENSQSRAKSSHKYIIRIRFLQLRFPNHKERTEDNAAWHLCPTEVPSSNTTFRRESNRKGDKGPIQNVDAISVRDWRK